MRLRSYESDHLALRYAREVAAAGSAILKGISEETNY
jgi:hypothetical protein